MSKAPENKPRAVVFSYSRINSDPRLLRQISWLEELGFSVSIVGYGTEGLDVISAVNVPVQNFRARIWNYLKPHQKRFEGLFGQYLPSTLSTEVSNTDLIVVNELEFVHFLNTSDYSGSVYMDLHENHVDGLSGSWLEAMFFASYWKWQLEQAAIFINRFRSRIFLTTVEAAIAEKYKSHFGLDEVELIFNAPGVIDLPKWQPGGTFSLVHHGMAKSNRGIETIVKSMSRLRETATLTLMLVREPTIPVVATKVKLIKWARRLNSVVRDAKPVPVKEVSKSLSRHDISIVLGSNKSGNDLYALPNKFFQSIQAGLMVICGPNPAVSQLVNDYQLGVVLPDWKAKSLVAAIQSLTLEDVARFRSNVLMARHELSEDKSKEVFMRGIRKLMDTEPAKGGPQ